MLKEKVYNFCTTSANCTIIKTENSFFVVKLLVYHFNVTSLPVRNLKLTLQDPITTINFFLPIPAHDIQPA